MDNDTILIPFSDNFDNYDYNGDKMIEYHEFMLAVTSSVGLIHPEELMEPFVFADADGKLNILNAIYDNIQINFQTIKHS